MTRMDSTSTSTCMCLAVLLLTAFSAQPLNAASVTLIAGGDVHWSDRSLRGQNESIVITNPSGVQVPVPWGKGWVGLPWDKGWQIGSVYLEGTSELDDSDKRYPEVRRWRKVQGILSEGYGLDIVDEEAWLRYPFEKLSKVIKGADIAFANLETPLSDRGRRVGYKFRGPPRFAEALADAGFDVVSTANNLAVDAGERGLLDTLEHLDRADVSRVGSGHNLAEARRPAVVTRNGIKVAFLAYTQTENSGQASFALSNRSGVAPLDLGIVRQDIQSVRDEVDIVAVSLHWGIENVRQVHPAARQLARDVIDAGADIILGHHPHVPRGIEVYRQKVIAYSFGNMVFGHNMGAPWGDNILARFILSPGRVERVEVLPISGQGQALSQPAVLRGEPAARVLEGFVKSSAQLNATVTVEGDIAVIVPATAEIVPGAEVPLSIPMPKMGRYLIFTLAVAVPLVIFFGWRLIRRRQHTVIT